MRWIKKGLVVFLFLNSTLSWSQTIDPYASPQPSGGIDFLPLMDPQDRRFILQHVALRQYAQALDRVKIIRQQTSHPIREPLLAFFMGVLAYKDKRYHESTVLLKRAYELSPYLKEYIRYWLGRVLIKRGKYEEALLWLTIEDSSGPWVKEKIFWERVKATLSLKNWDELRLLMDKKKRENSITQMDQIKVSYFGGLALAGEGKTSEAVEEWKKILIAQPGSPYEESIKVHLNRDLNLILSKEEWLTRAEGYMANGESDKAVQIYKTLSSSENPLMFEMAKAEYQSKNYPAAIPLLEAILRTSKRENRMEIMNMLATSYGRTDQFDQALRYQKKIQRLYSRSSSARDAP